MHTSARTHTCLSNAQGCKYVCTVHRTLTHARMQVYAHLSRKYGGTGLGLVITKKIIEAMEGSISFTSLEGEGTTFRISIEFALATGADYQVLVCICVCVCVCVCGCATTRLLE